METQNVLDAGLWEVCIVFFAACTSGGVYAPSHLTKIPEEELLRRIKADDFPPAEQLIFRDMNGKEIPLDSLQAMELRGTYFEDFYADDQGNIKEIVIRPKTPEDEALLAKINQVSVKPLEKMTIDCARTDSLLNAVLAADQGNREGDGIDHDIDHRNLSTVVNLLEQCGFPEGKIQAIAVWLVIQHAPAQYRKQYFPMLQSAADRGVLGKDMLALTIDRMLMEDGKPQKYGSQIGPDGKLYQLEAPETVDQRRRSVGLGPLKDYLKGFGVEFDVPQKADE